MTLPNQSIREAAIRYVAAKERVSVLRSMRAAERCEKPVAGRECWNGSLHQNHFCDSCRERQRLTGAISTEGHEVGASYQHLRSLVRKQA